MFSPDAAISTTASARNPRRRQRTGSDDSVAIRHNPKRIRRSGLSSETFQPPNASRQNGHIEQVQEEPYTNGHAKEPGSQRLADGDATSLAIRHRGVKKADRDRRTNKDHGSIILSKTENYTVSQLATTPEALQKHDTLGKWHGDLSTNIGYALAMSASHATVWRYAQGQTPADYTRPVTIRLLHSSSNPHHPLPLGVLVPTSSEPALLVVTPASGKITYWETLSSAATAEANRQKQQSVQGGISGLLSGEIVTNITEAEPRGFVLTFSTGRLAHLIINDTQGKSSIAVNFLRDSSAQSAGVFGSLRSVFSGSGWKRDVAAVRAGRSYQRGQRYMVVATTTGNFQVWDLNWNGTHTLVSDVNAKADILQSLAEAGDVFQDQQEHLFEVLDFSILSSPSSSKELATMSDSAGSKLMVLTVLKGGASSRYALVGLTLTDGSVRVDVVHPILSYRTPMSPGSDFGPRLLVPNSAEMAYVIFEKSLALVSLAEIPEGPSSQLQMEADLLNQYPFQDVVDFRSNKPYRVVGCALEPADRGNDQPSCTVMVYGFGLVRFSAMPVKPGQSGLDRKTVTAKTKMEQAVFFGNLQQDLLDFSPRSEISFSPEEIESAALSVSLSILDSTSAYIAAIGPSMDQELHQRSTALANLNKYLRKHHQSSLRRLTRWKLLWNAEKMAAARAIWRCYDLAIKEQGQGSSTKNVLAELIEAMSEDMKTENQPEDHETDGVRHWFVHDVWRLENILPWAQNIVEILFQEAREDNLDLDLLSQAGYACQANDIQLAGLETAFKFREANAAAYGLEDEVMREGVLVRGYEELPELWTSTRNIVERVKLQTDVTRELVVAILTHIKDEERPPQVVVKIVEDNPRQVQICCQTYIERSRWLKSRPDADNQTAGEKLMEAHLIVRKMLFVSLADIGMAEEGIKLAEKYLDMEALVNVIDQDSLTADDETIERYERLVETYFVRYGTSWANAYFAEHLNGGEAVDVLTGSAEISKHLTKFLRDHPPYAKLCWINDVVTEREFMTAADSLEVASKHETNLWSKKIGLSMSKLSLMAAKSAEETNNQSAQTTMHRIDEEVAALGTQEKLFRYIKPTVRDALDADAETDLAMQKYGTDFVQGKSMLRKSLEKGMRKLLAMETLNAEGLIDLLTLLDEDNADTDDERAMSERFLSAFKVLRLSNLQETDPGRKELLGKIIWRRCMIQDNWKDINRTELKDDIQVEIETGATSLSKTLREGYRTGFWEPQPPLPPSSVLDAGTTLDSLRTSTHFANMPSNTLEHLSHDLELEAEALDQCIEKGRLEEWWKGVVEAAKSSARSEADEEGEERLRRRDEEQEFEERMERKDRGAYEDVEGGGQRDVDGEGDVIMD